MSTLIGLFLGSIEDTVMSTLGVVVSVCLSVYLALMMMRRRWHRQQTRAARLADVVVRRHLAESYPLMVSRFGLGRHGRAAGSRPGTPPGTPALAVTPFEPTTMRLRRGIGQLLEAEGVVLLTPDEQLAMVDACAAEVRRRIWFVHGDIIRLNVQQAYVVAYAEVHTRLLMEFQSFTARCQEWHVF